MRSFVLTAEVARVNGLDAWTYNGVVPGPELRVNQGERLRVTLVNHLPAATTIHWHGYPLPNAEDGVAGLTRTRSSPEIRTPTNSASSLSTGQTEPH
ncbi:MAG: multicopper oxidase domain-containing protein [Candidatus Dormibacteraceae bacterium]